MKKFFSNQVWCAGKKGIEKQIWVYAPFCDFPLIKYSHNLYACQGEDSK